MFEDQMLLHNQVKIIYISSRKHNSSVLLESGIHFELHQWHEYLLCQTHFNLVCGGAFGLINDFKPVLEKFECKLRLHHGQLDFCANILYPNNFQ